MSEVKNKESSESDASDSVDCQTPKCKPSEEDLQL